MELQPIGQVSKQYEISIQTLRYYEQIGLIQSTRNDDNAYRFYDEAAVKQLHSIILLRKLRISLKQIKEILDNQNTAATVEILERNISELDEEITSLSTVKSILTRFAEELRIKTDMVMKLDLLNDAAALSIADSISFSKNYINKMNSAQFRVTEQAGIHYVKGNVTMENLNKANETLNKLKDSDVRIVYLPPMTVAFARGLAGTKKGYTIEKFVRETGLLKIKPDARGMVADNFPKEYLKAEHFEKLREKDSEYEVWVSIPDNMEVPAPLTKKTFEGGLYAAHLVRNGILEDFCFLAEWANASEKYEFDEERPFFQELLNYCNYYRVMPNYEEGAKRDDIQQGDLLLPIKKITE
ncbi:MAG: MerR family transcriptional regulator [Oscillospiraceae bacterium]|nr:MerR family transcriptional regulator [Oscillospiraceae bacterium]